ncbi:MAG: hypothetical protein IKK39_01785, partial [Thermoguttaceae bacterium]|nr:hypothetical protein [Thermoguttaceae bacterium]
QTRQNAVESAESLKFARRFVDTFSKRKRRERSLSPPDFSVFLEERRLNARPWKTRTGSRPLPFEKRRSQAERSTARRATTFNVGGSSTLKEGRRGAKIADNF